MSYLYNEALINEIEAWNQVQLLEKLAENRPYQCYCDECEPGDIEECESCKRLMPWCGLPDGYLCEICFNKLNDIPKEFGGEGCMTSIIFQNPYTTILQAIWGIIIEISQATGNNLADRLHLNLSTKNRHYEYNTNSGAGNPLGRLPHPKEWGCGVTNERRSHKPQPVETILEAEEGVIQLEFADIDIAINNRLTSSELRLWLYLERVKPSKPTSKELAKRLGTDPRTIDKAVDRLAEVGLCESPNRIEYTYTEKVVRDRLHQQLGGLKEVFTSVGKIDLLTNAEIIEVKAFKDWKAALGQILVYSAFHPEHQKRIHLFGTAVELAKLADIQAACTGFDVLVTGEEVSDAF